MYKETNTKLDDPNKIYSEWKTYLLETKGTIPKVIPQAA
jgi:hypothetical protein